MRLPALLAALVLAVPAARAAAAPEVPLLIPHNGRLLDATSNGVQGAVTLKFSLYAVAQNPDSGAPIPPDWTATYQVSAVDGNYAVTLGDVSSGQDPIRAELFDGTKARYLGIGVNGETELKPRLRVGSVPHALLAARAFLAEDAKLFGGEVPASYRDASKLTGVAPASVLGAGASTISTVGTITEGTWNGTPVADAFIASADAWNGKLAAVAHAPALSGEGTEASPLGVVFGDQANTVVQGNDARFKALADGITATKADATTAAGTAKSEAITAAAAAADAKYVALAGGTMTGRLTANGGLVAKGANFTDAVGGGLFRGNFMGTNRSTSGLEKNILFNAPARFTVTQTGPAPLDLPSLFDGNMSPAYSNAAPTAAAPQVFLLEGLPGVHTQAGAWIGWTTRYWPMTKFKIETYDVHLGRNTWTTIADHSTSAYSGTDFIVGISDQVVTKIRLTVFETSGTAGALGISEFFFIHPEVYTPYYGAVERSEAFTAWLTNADDLKANTAAVPILKYTNVQQNSAPDVFELQADGGLKFKKAGVVDLTANVDVIVRTGVNYAQMNVNVNGTRRTRTLAPNTGGNFAQLSATLVWKVAAGDVITITGNADRASSVDNGDWSTLTVKWTGLP